MSAPPENRRRGALLAIAAAALFAAMGAIIKVVAHELPNEMVVFFRNLFGLAALLPWIWRAGFASLHTDHFHLHLSRSVAGLAAMYCYFYALAHLPLADAVLLNFTAPLFIPLLSIWWLREAVPRVVWGAVAIGFVGVALSLKPTADLFTVAAAIGLASGALAAIAVTSIRHMAETEPTVRIVFYFATISALLSAVPLTWAWQTPTLPTWGMLLGIGALATVAQLFLTQSYTLAPVAQVGPLTYVAVIFAGLIGWLAWGEIPDVYSFVGALLVCCAGILAIRKRGWGWPTWRLIRKG